MFLMHIYGRLERCEQQPPFCKAEIVLDIKSLIVGLIPLLGSYALPGEAEDYQPERTLVNGLSLRRQDFHAQQGERIAVHRMSAGASHQDVLPHPDAPFSELALAGGDGESSFLVGLRPGFGVVEGEALAVPARVAPFPRLFRVGLISPIEDPIVSHSHDDGRIGFVGKGQQEGGFAVFGIADDDLEVVEER